MAVTINGSTGIEYDDNVKLIMGTSDDLELYHSGSHSHIKDSGTGHLQVDGSRVQLRNIANDDPMVDCTGGGTVEIFHNGTKRFETTSVGTTITGGGDRALKVNSTHSSGGEIAYFDNGVNNHYGGLLISAGENDREARLEAAYNGSHMSFYTSPDAGAGTEKLRIRKDGNILIGMQDFSSTPSASNHGISLHNTNNASVWAAGSATTNSHIIWANTNGTCGSIQTEGTGTSYNTSSDYRLKENIVGITDGITRVKQLAPKRFNFKTNASKVLDGFLAHEVTPIVPEAISGEKDAVITQAMVDNKEYEEDRLGEILPQGIDQAKLVPLLTAALQEAITEIETLKTKVAALEAA